MEEEGGRAGGSRAMRSSNAKALASATKGKKRQAAQVRGGAVARKGTGRVLLAVHSPSRITHWVGGRLLVP